MLKAEYPGGIDVIYESVGGQVGTTAATGHVPARHSIIVLQGDTSAGDRETRLSRHSQPAKCNRFKRCPSPPTMCRLLRPVLTPSTPRLPPHAAHPCLIRQMFDLCVDALADRGTLVVIGMMSAYSSGWQRSAHEGLAEK